MAINSTQGITAGTTAQASQGGDFRQPNSSSIDPSSRPAVTGKEVTALSSKKLDPAQQMKLLNESVSKLNNFMSVVSIGLKFSIDSDTKQTVVKVMNKDTGEVIRQIPSEEALKLSKAMDTLQGLIIQQKV